MVEEAITFSVSELFPLLCLTVARYSTKATKWASVEAHNGQSGSLPAPRSREPGRSCAPLRFTFFISISFNIE